MSLLGLSASVQVPPQHSYWIIVRTLTSFTLFFNNSLVEQIALRAIDFLQKVVLEKNKQWPVAV